MMVEERFLLARERIKEILTEDQPAENFRDYFHGAAAFLELLCEVFETVREGRLKEYTLEQLKELNERLYQDILPEHYTNSYGNPDYCTAALGKEYGRELGFLYGELRGAIPFSFEGEEEALLIRMELFLEIYGSFICGWEECGKEPDPEQIREILYYYVSDYTRDAFYKKLSCMLCPKEDFALRLIMDSDLSDPRYLYRFGEYITENELRTWEHLNELPESVIQKMADTYTEGYRIGFEVGNKDISKKKTVNIRYCLGFERMIQKAVRNFEKMGLQVTIYRAASSVLQGKGMNRIGYYGAVPNKQYDYDHKDDQALVLDKKLMQVRMEAWQEAYESLKEEAAVFGGPAVAEVFGEAPVQLQEKETALHLSKMQQKLTVEYMAAVGELQNRYIKGEERSFTIIAFPTPEIGERYEEIFDEIIKINTLDYTLYQKIQQKIIDVLDQGKYVIVKGMNGNRTDLKIMLHELKDPLKQTNFENCVADVNIPVGEVFTSPVLSGTEGVLHVSRVFLNELEYKNITLSVKDGMLTDYSCDNFEKEEENRKYIRDNVLFHHETLPMGEFAVGTNTTAFVAARKYQIEDKLPILIAEKTGPHFAFGDTCYSHAEEVAVFNPDGKEIIARDNECSLKRKEDMAAAYFNCHTDITIPYDELGEISVITAQDRVIPVIEEGRFVLAGCEQLNIPFEQL